MKLSLPVLFLVVSGALTQGCDVKPKEATAEEIAANEKAKKDSIETAVAEQRTIKRAELEKSIADKAEKRRLAAIEKAKKSESYKDSKGKTIYMKADAMPVYAGGNAEMMKYLKDNLQYPSTARETGEEGTVFVDFVIDKTGKVIDVVANDAVNDDVNSLLKTESIRVVSTMPDWKPATHKGKIVAAAYSIPIKFELYQ